MVIFLCKSALFGIDNQIFSLFNLLMVMTKLFSFFSTLIIVCQVLFGNTVMADTLIYPQVQFSNLGDVLFEVTTSFSSDVLFTKRDSLETVLFYIFSDGQARNAKIGDVLSVSFRNSGDVIVWVYVFRKHGSSESDDDKIVVNPSQVDNTLISSVSTPTISIMQPSWMPYLNPVPLERATCLYDPIHYIPKNGGAEPYTPFYIVPAEITTANALPNADDIPDQYSDLLPQSIKNLLNIPTNTISWSTNFYWSTNSFLLHQVLVDGKVQYSNNTFTPINSSPIANITVTNLNLIASSDTSHGKAIIELKNTLITKKAKILFVFKRKPKNWIKQDENYCYFAAVPAITVTTPSAIIAPTPSLPASITLPSFVSIISSNKISIEVLTSWKMFRKAVGAQPHDPAFIGSDQKICTSCPYQRFTLVSINDAIGVTEGVLFRVYVSAKTKLSNIDILESSITQNLGTVFDTIVHDTLDSMGNKIIDFYFPNAHISGFSFNGDNIWDNLTQTYGLFTFVAKIQSPVAGDSLKSKIEVTYYNETYIDSTITTVVVDTLPPVASNTITTSVGNSWRPSVLFPWLNISCGLNTYDDSFGDLDNKTIFYDEDTATLHVYPNPVTDFVTVSYQSIPNTRSLIKVLDLSGKKLLEQEDYTTIDQIQHTTLNLSLLESGMYLVQINNANGIFTQKLIKQ